MTVDTRCPPISCMRPLAGAVVPHPPHNGDSSSATQPHHPRVCSRSHTKNSHRSRGTIGNPTCQRRSTRQRTWTASRPMFAEPSLVSRRETWRPYVPHFFATHRTVMRDRTGGSAHIFPWHSTAWHGFPNGEIWGCTGRLLPWFHSALFVVMAKDDGVFSYVNRACGCGEALFKSLVMS
jgi:hypothetical protein